MPSVVDLRDYPPPPEAPATTGIDRPFTVGWIGSPSTTRYVQSLAEVLARVAASGPLRAVAVGASPLVMPGVALEQHPWSKAGEADEIAGFDVGVMPLDDAPWERGKCGYKLIQYMASARPVVASPVGVNVELAIPGVTGEIATTPDDWVGALERLRAMPAERLRLGANGRALVERQYALQVTAPRLAALLHEVAGEGRGAARAGR
ncbi:MAG: glycosyltransferase [Vicinamibacterales bacterium]